jgi:hypothetical protein
MGLSRIVASDPARNVLIAMLTLENDDGTPVDPVTASLPVTVAFVPVGSSPDTATWLAADWVAAADGSFRARCQVGSAATGALAAGFYQPYIQVVNGGETITVPAADVLESY